MEFFLDNWCCYMAAIGGPFLMQDPIQFFFKVFFFFAIEMAVLRILLMEKWPWV